MIGAFFAWWIAQLTDLLPSWLRRSAVTRSDAVVIAPAGPLDDPGAVAVGLRRRGSEAPLGRFGLGAADLKKLPRSRGRPAVLRLRRADVLEKTLALPLAAEAELEQVLAFEMDRETPFRSDDVYWNHRIEAVDRPHARLSVRLLVVPKARLSRLLAALAQAGIEPRWAEIADDSDGIYVPLGGDRLRPQPRSRHLLRVVATVCAILAIAAVLMPFLRQAMELAALDRAVAAGRAAAARTEAVRRDIDRTSRGADLIGSELAKAGRPLDVVAAITKLLPDDTYLTELDMRQGKLTLSGRSAGAARLIGLLAADGRFHNLAFAAPVTRVEALHAEVFTIVSEQGTPR